MSISVSRLLSLIFVLVFSFFHLACSGLEEEQVIPIKKYGGGAGGGAQKPDQKASDQALKDEVLLTFQTLDSKVISLNEKVVVLKSELKVNKKLELPWRSVFKIKIGDSQDLELPEDFGLIDFKLGLKVRADRIKKDQNKNDAGYLVLSYQLGRVTDSEDQTKKSLTMVLIDLNKWKTSKAVLITEVIYPIPEDFNFQKWVDKQLKEL